MAQRDQRVDAAGAETRNAGCDNRHDEQERGGGKEDRGLERADAEKQALEQAADDRRSDGAGGKADRNELEAGEDDVFNDPPPRRAERQVHAQLAGARCDAESDHRVQANA